MSILTPSNLETHDYCTDGWNSTYNANFQALNDDIGAAMNTGETEDFNIKATTNDGTTNAINVVDKDSNEIFAVDSNGKVSIQGTQILTTQQASIADASVTVTGTADATYDTTEQDMLNALKNDVNNLKTQLNLVIAALEAHGLIST